MITALTLRSLAVRRGERLLFDGVDLDLGSGQAAALTGPNGAGKTTLLRTIAGFVRAERGIVRFEGASGEIEPALARQADCHLLGHQDGLKPGRSARAELMFQAKWTGASHERALAAARRLGLDGLLGLEVRGLSAGQRRRLALARLLAAPRRLWLLDEPLAPLDRASRALFAGIMTEHLSSGGLIVAAVHDALPIPVLTLELGA